MCGMMDIRYVFVNTQVKRVLFPSNVFSDKFPLFWIRVILFGFHLDDVIMQKYMNKQKREHLTGNRFARMNGQRNMWLGKKQNNSKSVVKMMNTRCNLKFPKQPELRLRNVRMTDTITGLTTASYRAQQLRKRSLIRSGEKQMMNRSLRLMKITGQPRNFLSSRKSIRRVDKSSCNLHGNMKFTNGRFIGAGASIAPAATQISVNKKTVMFATSNNANPGRGNGIKQVRTRFIKTRIYSGNNFLQEVVHYCKLSVPITW